MASYDLPSGIRGQLTAIGLLACLLILVHAVLSATLGYTLEAQETTDEKHQRYLMNQKLIAASYAQEKDYQALKQTLKSHKSEKGFEIKLRSLSRNLSSGCTFRPLPSKTLAGDILQKSWKLRCSMTNSQLKHLLDWVATSNHIVKIPTMAITSSQQQRPSINDKLNVTLALSVWQWNAK